MFTDGLRVDGKVEKWGGGGFIQVEKDIGLKNLGSKHVREPQ